MGIKTQIKAKELESSNQFNISLLGFKMAITEGLTVFNLVDGIVDEFEDQSGTDESASTSLTYNSTDDYYVNSTSPTGVAYCTPAPFSAGFTTTTITEPDTSTAGTNPTQGSGTYGSFTVPNGLTSLSVFVWGAGGAGISNGCNNGGGGGFASGTFAVTPGQSLTAVVGEGGNNGGSDLSGGLGGYRPSPAIAPNSPYQNTNTGGGGGDAFPGSSGYVRGGGGLSGLFTGALSGGAPVAVVIAGSGGGGEYSNPQNGLTNGGGAGGLQGYSGGGYTLNSQSSANGNKGGGGSQTSGGQGGSGSPNGGPGPFTASPGGLFYGGNNALATEVNNTFGGGGGAGYYGGGGGSWTPGNHGAGGGGSSYYGHPQVTSGSTTAASSTSNSGGGISEPNYVPSTNNGAVAEGSGQDGYVLLTGTGSTPTPASTTSSTIISDPFTANTLPTNTRIVIFEENVGTPTLNTDIIASVSRNGGSNYTTVTLSDSGYVTGSSGQRILTGQADISGQPSGQSMKWRLQLANQTVKIHGVSLQWS